MEDVVMEPIKYLSAIRENMQKVVVGKEDVIDKMLIALVCSGHVLVEDLPGLGKTTLVSALAASLGCRFQRIQFTPDVLPSDITGFNMYQMQTGEQVFHFGPMFGTNNIGEFLAIVHGLALLKQKGIDIPIYSDSYNALLWIKSKKCKTKLPRDSRTEELFQYVDRAEKWLKENSYSTTLIKWETDKWGEIPADFGRK